MKIDRNRTYYVPFPFVVVCRRHRHAARFESAFEFHRDGDLEGLLADRSLSTLKYSGGVVVERYPDVFSWSDPDNYWIGFNRPVAGVVNCTECPARYKHIPDWPEDAYYRLELPQGLLWAWDREHLQALLQFIESESRYTGVGGGRFSYFLRHIPKEFLAVKDRSQIAKGIRRVLDTK